MFFRLFENYLCRLVQNLICNLPLSLNCVMFSGFVVIQCQSFPFNFSFSLRCFMNMAPVLAYLLTSDQLLVSALFGDECGKLGEMHDRVINLS